MNSREQFREQEGPVSRMEYDDGSMVLAADVGADREATVDVVGDTVIVVTDDDQYEFELSGDETETEGDAQAFMKNGVLTVEVEA
ncbi:DUF7127 family protein [Halorientalis salina]|uniref:DUF7127 family protein n=1 Tax=Halorientalis salina TaxID=2932266 RepID=UPI0010AC058F|nr:Hsp20/alpha crystallin family protein [Halorientalis salina]